MVIDSAGRSGHSHIKVATLSLPTVHSQAMNLPMKPMPESIVLLRYYGNVKLVGGGITKGGCNSELDSRMFYRADANP